MYELTQRKRFKIDLIRINDKISEMKRGKKIKQKEKPILLTRFRQKSVNCKTVMRVSSRRTTFRMLLYNCPSMAVCRKKYFC